MSHSARTHASWMSALVVVAITASCVTWLCGLYRPGNEVKNPKGQIISGTSVAKMLSIYQNASSMAHGIFKVNRSVGDRLTWVEECCVRNLTLDQSKSWITVEKKGIYLIYLQMTYGLKTNKNGGNSVNLDFFVDFNHTENSMELAAAFDNRQLMENEQDAYLSAFLLLNMQAKEELSVRAHPEEQLKFDDHQPFSSYITIIRYADW